ncbi:unnamed protein product [Effrenium voratum]|nr:unnamed protein product [Effrenium voratum]|mmetsp:Transcript_78769/g.189001  ORF Transcript_78769/g.189001 Transcript_78769/m.189001 type:complete len:446 (+) Transcript_78769:57-1394(+)
MSRQLEDEAAAKRLFNQRLFVIGSMRLIDSMNVTMIMPYGLELMSMLLNQDKGSAEVGTAFAWFIGLYSLCEIVFSPLWGMAADNIGRRPVLLIGIAGTAIAPILLGLGQSLPLVFAFRALGGFFCGNQAILRTYLGEIADKNNEARAFSILVLCFVVGMMAGPFLGGLAFPARWAPQVFEGTLFAQHPVLLPNLLFGASTAIVCIIGFLWLEETLPSKQVDHVDLESEDSDASGVTRCCYSMTVLQAILAFCGLAGAVEAQNTLVVLLWQYPHSQGGFGFSPQQVSVVQVSGGLGPIVCHLTFLQKLVRKLGFLKVLGLGFLINSCSYSLYPVYALFADPANYGLWRYVILGLAEFVGMSGTFLLFSSVFVFMNRASEGLNRATVNGWANSSRALSRAISPLVATQLLQTFSALPLGGYVPFYIITACLGIFFALAWTGLRKLN